MSPQTFQALAASMPPPRFDDGDPDLLPLAMPPPRRARLGVWMLLSRVRFLPGRARR